MKKETLGTTISTLRKNQGMTQLELAQQMGVTDKAVSKWERDLACPDVNSLPKLAQLLGVSVDELMQVKTGSQESGQMQTRELAELICRAVALAMGVAVIVLSVLKQIDLYSAVGMLGVGLVSLAVRAFLEKKAEQ